ncbi:MAG: flavodoxin family protein [Myxococcaceae bacterium]|nr:flavodoxin family protein [Myxococcaceae bacterium]
MKVLLINGSPHRDGCTFTALQEVAHALERHGVATRLIHTGTRVQGCLACGRCLETGYCAVGDDGVNEAIDLLRESDGLVVGAPVHYASAAAALSAFLDRMFYGKSRAYAFKPAAAIVSCRRGGASASFDRLNKYFTISAMPIVSSNYWNEVHGTTPDEVRQDAEGLQTMRLIGDAMAWMIRCFALAKSQGIAAPTLEPKIFTNFIR